jgi:hypothetical protein
VKGSEPFAISAPIWDASIVPIEVCGVYICDTSRIIEAIAFAADFDSERSFAGKRIPRVLNLSLGSALYSYQMANAIKYAQSKDVLVIAAAGNSSLPALAFYPASYPDVISVGATDQNDQLTGFSNYGPRSLTLVAPGLDILAAVPRGTDYFAEQYGFHMLGDDLAFLNGTSMASPLVTAAAAMVRAFKPELRQDEVRRILNQSGEPVPAQGFDGFFYKRLDAYRAIQQSAVAESVPRAENSIEEEVVVDVRRTCHVGYNPTYPCENCIRINGAVGNADTQKTRIRWMYFNLLPVFPEPLAFSEVTKDSEFYEEIEYFLPEYGNAGMQITNNFHFLIGFVEDRDSSGEVRSLRPVRFSNGETFFDIGRTPCQ